jgi:hypothetical protein
MAAMVPAESIRPCTARQPCRIVSAQRENGLQQKHATWEITAIGERRRQCSGG